MSSMQIEVSQMQGKVPVTVFHLTGDIDANTFESFQAQAEASIESGTRNLLLDMTRVKYITSAGMRAMHAIFIKLQNVSGEGDEATMAAGIRAGTFKSPHLKLLKPSRDAFTALQHAGFDMFLDTFDDLDKAIASY